MESLGYVQISAPGVGSGVAEGGEGGPSPPANEKNININLTLNMCCKNDKKISHLSSPDSFFSSSKCTKIRFRPGPAPDPAGGAYDAPPDPLVGWGGGYSLLILLPTRRLRRLGSQARGPLNTKSWLYASGSW